MKNNKIELNLNELNLYKFRYLKKYYGLTRDSELLCIMLNHYWNDYLDEFNHNNNFSNIPKFIQMPKEGN